QGLGAGSNPDDGRNAAQEDPDQITRLLSGCDMVFITAGLRGRTGTGAAPAVAAAAKDLCILTVAVVTKPFTVEGRKRMPQADVRAIMSGMGLATMGSGTGKGENRAIDAAQKAVASPLLDETSIEGARGILINFTGGADLSIHEVEEAARIVQEAAHEEAHII